MSIFQKIKHHSPPTGFNTSFTNALRICPKCHAGQDNRTGTKGWLNPANARDPKQPKLLTLEEDQSQRATLRTGGGLTAAALKTWQSKTGQRYSSYTMQFMPTSVASPNRCYLTGPAHVLAEGN